MIEQSERVSGLERAAARAEEVFVNQWVGALLAGFSRLLTSKALSKGVSKAGMVCLAWRWERSPGS